jgi:hypothetical protein
MQEASELKSNKLNLDELLTKKWKDLYNSK